MTLTVLILCKVELLYIYLNNRARPQLPGDVNVIVDRDQHGKEKNKPVVGLKVHLDIGKNSPHLLYDINVKHVPDKHWY